MMKRMTLWACQVAIVGAAAAGLCFAVPLLRARLAPGETASPSDEAPGGPRLVAPDTVRLEPEAVRSLGLRVARVAPARRARALPPLLGSLTLDPNQLAHVQARFTGEVVELGKVKVSEEGTYRSLTYGDRVEKGDLLAVLWSKELGEKKSELVDAWSQWKLDQVTLDRLKEAFASGAVPEARLREARRAVEVSKIAVRRAERTLRVWRVTNDEIRALTAEAERLRQKGAERDTALEECWARVEIRAPLAGVILERNVNPHENVNDTTRDLFKIANLDRLKVWAYALQEDLPTLQALPRPLRWTVHLRTGAASCVEGTVEHMSELVDTAQRAVLLIGNIENASHQLRVGQLISVTIEADPPEGVLELPTSALVEDGEESVVFVQSRPGEPEYRLCPVRVVCRHRDAVLVQTAPGGADAPLRTGASVVTSGAVELRTVLEGLSASASRQDLGAKENQ